MTEIMFGPFVIITEDGIRHVVRRGLLEDGKIWVKLEDGWHRVEVQDAQEQTGPRDQ